MRISVITPSFRNSEWLRLCVASVADQGGDVEHIVQDAGSDDGTLDWLPGDPRVKAVVESDRGMYDAVNRGLTRATGEVLAYLNCDEQYLPGTLEGVREYFGRNPDVDVVFADIVVVDESGGYLCHRKVQTPLKYHTWLCHLSTLTCATFFHRRVIDEMGILFNPALRADGDGQWVLELIRKRARFAVMRRFASVFTQRGANLGQHPTARSEKRESVRKAPLWARAAKPVFICHHWLRRFSGGMYSQKPFQYAIYTVARSNKRVVFDVPTPTARWRGTISSHTG